MPVSKYLIDSLVVVRLEPSCVAVHPKQQDFLYHRAEDLRLELSPSGTFAQLHMYIS